MKEVCCVKNDIRYKIVAEYPPLPLRLFLDYPVNVEKMKTSTDSSGNIVVPEQEIFKQFSLARSPVDGDRCVCGVYSDVECLVMDDNTTIKIPIGTKCIHRFKNPSMSRELKIIQCERKGDSYCVFCVRKNKLGNHDNCQGRQDIIMEMLRVCENNNVTQSIRQQHYRGWVLTEKQLRCLCDSRNMDDENIKKYSKYLD